jgi:release factor glutamine methyltransferase
LKIEAEPVDVGALRALLGASEQILLEAGVESARLDAALLLGAAAAMSRAEVLAGMVTLDDRVRERFAASVARRAAREPLAYILGHKEFNSLELEIGPGVLIPRPETEILVEVALEILSQRREARVLDLGTGSGAIAVAIAAHAPASRIVATDLSTEALEMARRNIRRFALKEQIEIRRADGFTAMDSDGELGSFDLIVSNPPYVPDGDISRLQPEVSRYEPRSALAGGLDGLSFYRMLARQSRRHLGDRGRVAVEVGAGQAADVSAIFRAQGFSAATMRRDLAGIPRVVCVR